VKRAWSPWIPVVAWCAVIFGFSSVPDLNSGLSYDYPLRKAAHMGEYAILYWLARRALADSGSKAFLFTVAYAASDEWHQTFVPGRVGAAADVAVDAAGAALAAALTALRRRGMLSR
jgi:VanZ family protein